MSEFNQKSAFSDTTSLLSQVAPAQTSAAALAQRLGLPELGASDYGRWHILLFAAAHALLDRVEALEHPKEETNRG
jgi:hypothetical protein